MKNFVAVSICVFLALAFCAPVTAEAAWRRGTVQLVASNWGPVQSPTQFNNVFTVQHVIQVINRSDRAVNYRIVFYEQDGTEHTTAWNQIAGNGWARVGTNDLPELAALAPDTQVRPVVEWRGNVDIAPFCYAYQRLIGPPNPDGSLGDLIDYVHGWSYDDTMR